MERLLARSRSLTDCIGPLDEFPMHQAPLPLAWANSSDRNFYDRSYFNAHDRTGDIMVITGLGYYPNLGTKDAFVLVRRDDEQTAVHLSDLIDQDRLEPARRQLPHRGPRPAARRSGVVLEETEGIAIDLHLGGLFPRHPGAAARDALGQPGHPRRPAVRAARLVERHDRRSTARRSPSTPDRWLGSRDRSWGIRPVGEAEPPGARPTRRSRACGGSTSRCSSTTSPSA